MEESKLIISIPDKLCEITNKTMKEWQDELISIFFYYRDEEVRSALVRKGLPVASDAPIEVLLDMYREYLKEQASIDELKERNLKTLATSGSSKASNTSINNFESSNSPRNINVDIGETTHEFDSSLDSPPLDFMAQLIAGVKKFDDM